VSALRPVSLPTSVQRDLWWRSLALQAVWNHQRMQNLGLLYVLGVWARWRGLDADECRRLARRHVGYFNTNPYLAPYLLGGLARLEDEHREGGQPPEALLGAFRDSLSRACGALGDQLTWLGGRPAVMLLAALQGWWFGWWWSLVILAAATVVQLALRWRAVGRGWALGLDVVSVFERRIWHCAILWSGRLGLVLTGLLAGLFFAGGMASATGPGAVRLLAVLVIGVGVAVVPSRRHTCEAQFLVGLALLAALGLVI